METKENPNYTPAQENLIRKACEENGGSLNLAVAKALAADPAMNKSDGTERNYRSVVAKINRMSLPYDRKVATTKDGKAIAKKSDIVTRIAELAGVTVAKLDGLDKAPKGALETIRDALAA